MMNDNKLGDIKELRKKAGLTQSALAKTVGVDIKTIQNWEAGRPVPKTKYEILRNVLCPSHSIGDADGSTVVGANVSGSGNNISNNDAIALSKAIDEISEMRKIVQEQVKNNQEQFDRFMAVIEKLTSR
jgi:DNA-binding XRE family transcriptional regulator